MNHFNTVKQRILAQIGSDGYREAFAGTEQGRVDKGHFLEVVRITAELWEENEKTSVPEALKIAALYHDGDRIYPSRQVNTKDYPEGQYGYRKGIHSGNTALIFFENNLDLPRELVRDVCFLILRHEHGGDKTSKSEYFEKKDDFTQSYNLNLAADYLWYADKLSFFYSNIHEYAKRGKKKLMRKIEYSLEDLPPNIVNKIKDLKFEDLFIQKCVKENEKPHHRHGSRP